MPLFNLEKLRLTDTDLDFLVDAAASEVQDKDQLKQIIREDEDFRRTFIGDEKVIGKVMADDDILLKISPALYFEILLRKALSDLENTSYTIERDGKARIAVFDTKEVVELLDRQSVLVYLAHMLSSFARVESYALSFRVKKGAWRKIRFNDMDLNSLISFCEAIDEEYRFGFYKRIADICLFILGIFPEYARSQHQYSLSGEIRPPIAGQGRKSPEDFENEGRRFYKLAAEHQAAKSLELSEVFWLLHGNFHAAKKPLNFIADYYLHPKRLSLFGTITQ
jgi:hypothetical protein